MKIFNLNSPNDDCSKKFKRITKCLYDYGRKTLNDMDIFNKTENQSLKPIDHLIIKDMDNEQVWQQLDLFNQPFINNSLVELSKLLSKSNISLNIKMNDNENVSILKKSNLKSLNTQDNKALKKKVKFIDTFNENEKTNNVLSNYDFFNAKEMEQFLDNQDRLEMESNMHQSNDNDEDIDYFQDFSDNDDDDNNKAMYSDFFDPPNVQDECMDENFSDYSDDNSIELDPRDYDFGSINKASLDNEYDSINDKLKALANNDSESDDDLEKSEYEKSQIKLKNKIKKAEDDLLMPNNLKWQYSGEITGDVRPPNSLLEEYLQFDHISRPAPIITDETTKNLEELIKQRIKDKIFDDVERKVKPTEQPFEFRRRVMLESEKSKVGLAEIYEQEYAKQLQKQKEQELGAKVDSFITAGEEEEDKTRKEIRKSLMLLFRQLDSLSAFHYTPRPPEPEVKIINNLPAVFVEEAVPDSINDMKLLAPEEVFSTRNKMTLQSKEERNTTDRKRARRLKKKKQGIKQKFQLQKQTDQQISLKTKKQNLKMNDDTTAADKKCLSTSTKFFEKLQEKNSKLIKL